MNFVYVSEDSSFNAKAGTTDWILVLKDNQYQGPRHSYYVYYNQSGGSVAEWLACWTEAQKGLGSNRSRDAVG